MASPSTKKSRQRTGAKTARTAPPDVPVAAVSAAVIESAALRAGWVLAAGRAEQIAASAEPVVRLFEGVSQIIDFDSDPLAFAVVRDNLKHREPS